MRPAAALTTAALPARAAIVLVMLLAAVVAAGCGGAAPGSHRPQPRRLSGAAATIATVPCGPVQHPTIASAAAPGVYRAGPVTVSVATDLAQLPARGLPAFSGEVGAILTVSRDEAVVLRVASRARDRFALEFLPGQGNRPAVPSSGNGVLRFPACGASRPFVGSLLFSAPGCTQVQVTDNHGMSAELLIPVAGSLQGCPRPRAVARLAAGALPFLGVACGVANSIRCHRVGVGVVLRHPAALVVVRVAGRMVSLSPPDPPSDLWQGYLGGISFRRGPLRIPVGADVGSWSGSPEVWPRVQETAFLPGGGVAGATASVLLHPGFG